MNARNLGLGAVAIATLAGLDLLGAYFAKDFVVRPRWGVLVAGVVSFGVLFLVYVASLRWHELWVVTFAWVTLLEIGVIVMDRARFGTVIPARKLVLAGLIIVLQVALMAPSSRRSSSPAPARTPAADGSSSTVSSLYP